MTIEFQPNQRLSHQITELMSELRQLETGGTMDDDKLLHASNVHRCLGRLHFQLAGEFSQKLFPRTGATLPSGPG